MKSERAGDSEARRARRPARVWGNLVGGSVGGVCADNENGLVLLVKVRARANVNRDRMADFFFSLWWLGSFRERKLEIVREREEDMEIR